MNPKLFEHCVAVYDEMDAGAKDKSVTGEKSLRVYNGYTSALFEKLGLSLSTYTPVMQRLTDMGCAAQLWRGSRSRPSAWKLIRRPTPALFNSTRPKRRSRIADLEIRVASLEAALEEKAS